MIPLRDTVPSRNPPVATIALIAVNTLVYLATAFLPQQELLRLFYLAGVVPARYSDPQWTLLNGLPRGGILPFFSSMFLHGGFLHLLSNMWVLWIFGDNVEDRMGKARYLAFYLLAGLLAGVLQLAIPGNPYVPTIGASGAIAGVLGAYLALYPHARVLTVFPIFFYPLFFELPAYFYLGFWFLSQLLAGTMAFGSRSVGGVAWWAHVGGFLAGYGLHRYFLRRTPAYTVLHDRAGRPVIDYPPRPHDRWGPPWS